MNGHHDHLHDKGAIRSTRGWIKIQYGAPSFWWSLAVVAAAVVLIWTSVPVVAIRTVLLMLTVGSWLVAVYRGRRLS